jgi:hypothetical protein
MLSIFNRLTTLKPKLSNPVITRAALSVLVAVLCAASATAQPGSTDVSGRWIWKQIARRNKPQIQFTLVVRRDGNNVRGTYSVDEFIDGVWQGEDGNQTPFAGRIKAGETLIEFDPMATQPGYETNVSYTAPSDGRKPSIASVSRSGANLIWRLVRGPGIEGVPAKVTLRRERR